MTKEAIYKWAKPGDKGRRAQVPLEDLNIDYSYQREEVSNFNTLAIARDFNWAAFNTLLVMERPNGELYVVDGQQRLCAAKKRGDIVSVPCLIFQSDGPEREAKAFRAANERRKHVGSHHKFRAAIVAKDQPETDIADWLRSQGLTASNNGKNPTHLSFIYQLVKDWKANKEVAQRAIVTQIAMSNGEPLKVSIHKGLVWMCTRSIRIEDYVELIARIGGSIAMIKEINTMQIELNLPATERLAGLAIVRLINKHLKVKKIRIGG